MNLHRTSKKPEWESVAPRDYTVFQKLAASTHGIASPANIITVIGLAIVLWGLAAILLHQLWLGLLLVVVGRLLDIADGMVAHTTHTKSPLGELFDATADKIGTFLTIIVLVVAGIVSWWVMVALILPQVLIALVILYKRSKNQAIHPSRQGKLSMAFLWVGLVGLFFVKLLVGFQILSVITAISVGLSVAFGVYALWQYITGRE